MPEGLAGCGLGVKERTPRQRGGEPRGQLRDAPSHESGDVTPPESDKPPYTHDREGFLLGELVDHGLGHAQERYDLLHIHEGLAQDILGGLGRSPPSDDRRRRPAHSDNLCVLLLSDFNGKGYILSTFPSILVSNHNNGAQP